MSDITPIGRTAPPSINSTVRAPRLDNPAAATRSSDRVELSDMSRLLSKLSELPAIRKDLVDRVRTEINAGSYDTPDKVDALMENLAEDLH